MSTFFFDVLQLCHNFVGTHFFYLREPFVLCRLTTKKRFSVCGDNRKSRQNLPFVFRMSEVSPRSMKSAKNNQTERRNRQKNGCAPKHYLPTRKTFDESFDFYPCFSQKNTRIHIFKDLTMCKRMFFIPLPGGSIIMVVLYHIKNSLQYSLKNFYGCSLVFAYIFKISFEYLSACRSASVSVCSNPFIHCR